MTLISLEEHNARRAPIINLGACKTGIACPDCGAEMVNPNPTVVLTSMPPQRYVKCEACGYSGTSL